MSERQSVRIDGKDFLLPFVNEIPFDAKQDAELRADIEEAKAVLVPIIVWKEKRTADSETVVDGAHRAIIASELGINVPISQRSFKTEEEALAYVQRVNYRRRHLTTEQMQKEREARVKRVIAARQEGQSTRTIAKSEGISQPQVVRDLKAATDTGVSVDPPNGRVQGQDGRIQTATPARPKQKPAEKDYDSPPDEQPSPAPAQAHKKNGAPIFDDRIVTDLLGKLTRALNDRSKALGKTAGFNRAWEQLEAFATAWKNLQMEVEKKR